MKILALGLVACAAAAGCKKQPDATAPGSAASTPGSAATGNAPAPAPPPAPAMAPEARARDVLQRQLDAGRDLDKLRATFAPDAIILTPGAEARAADTQMFGLADDGPGGVQVKGAKIAKLVAGGNAEAVWFYAEVTVEGPGAPGTTRAVELLAAPDWRAVAASFGPAAEFQGARSNSEIPGATGADGPLAKLLGAPASVADALAPDAIAVGPDKMASGAGARAALTGWQLVGSTVFQRSREIRKARWGFVQANLDRPRPGGKGVDRIVGQLFAVPEPDGTWRIVVAQYAAQ